MPHASKNRYNAILSIMQWKRRLARNRQTRLARLPLIASARSEKQRRNNHTREKNEVAREKNEHLGGWVKGIKK